MQTKRKGVSGTIITAWALVAASAAWAQSADTGGTPRQEQKDETAQATQEGQPDKPNIALLPAPLFVGQDLKQVQSAWDQPEKHLGPGQSTPGYKQIDYSWGRVMTIRTRLAMPVVIRFDETEHVSDIVIGDPTVLEGTIAGRNRVMVRALAAGVDLGVTILATSGRVYQFYVRAEPINADRITDLLVDVVLPSRSAGRGVARDAPGGPHARATEPGTSNADTLDMAPGAGAHRAIYASGEGWVEARAGARRVAAAHTGLTSGVGAGTRFMSERARGALTGTNAEPVWGNLSTVAYDPSQMRWDLKAMASSAKAAQAIAPIAASRDDRWTYLHYTGKAEKMESWPVVTLLVDDTESPVKQRVAGENRDILVVEAVGDLVLRDGARNIVCIRSAKRIAEPAAPSMADHQSVSATSRPRDDDVPIAMSLAGVDVEAAKRNRARSIRPRMVRVEIVAESEKLQTVRTRLEERAGYAQHGQAWIENNVLARIRAIGVQEDDATALCTDLEGVARRCEIVR